MPELLTVKETADALRLTPETVIHLIRRDEIPAAKVGFTYRIGAATVAKLLKPCEG